MNYKFLIATITVLTLPLFFLACSSTYPDSNDNENYTCDDLCSKANFCNAPCIPDDCDTHCEDTLSKDEISCAERLSCDVFNDCLCGSSDAGNDV